MRSLNIVLLVVLIVLVLFGVLYGVERVSEVTEEGVIGQKNDSAIGNVGVACSSDDECTGGLICGLEGKCYDACSRCGNDCTILGPNAGACLETTEQFNCNLINEVCTKIDIGYPVCGDGICGKGESPLYCKAQDCGVPCPQDCNENNDFKNCESGFEFKCGGVVIGARLPDDEEIPIVCGCAPEKCPEDKSILNFGINEGNWPDGTDKGFGYCGEDYGDDNYCGGGKIIGYEVSQLTGLQTEPTGCYTPPDDYGNFCDEPEDCSSGVCLAIVTTDKSGDLEGCEFYDDYHAQCDSVTGICGGGKDKSSIYIKEKKVIYRPIGE